MMLKLSHYHQTALLFTYFSDQFVFRYSIYRTIYWHGDHAVRYLCLFWSTDQV